MKQNISRRMQNMFARFILAVTVAFMSATAMAQEKKIDVNINTKGDGNFFASPWVWVVGVAVFILLLVALMRGGARRDV